MFKSRRRIAIEEGKKEPNFRPDSELEADESNLPEEEKGKVKVPVTALIIIGIIVLLMAVCIVVIYATGGPINGK